jgi:hypothetical protein
MNADDLAILGELKVPLDAVGALLPGQVECGEGVLRRIMRGTAVGDQCRHGENRARRRKVPETKLGCQVVIHAMPTPLLPAIRVSKGKGTECRPCFQC